MRKLVLVALDWTRPKDPPLSLGHASILAYLLEKNVNVISGSWSVNSPDFSPQNAVDLAIQHASSETDFAIGAFVWNESSVQYILKTLRECRFPGRLIVGGPQVSYVKKNLEVYYPEADVFIRGYAEEALYNLLLSSAQTSYPMIKGVHYANQPDFGWSATIDFEKLPSPYLTGLIKPQRFIRWETQRGCPFQCSFCQHRESDVSMQRRHLPVSRVIQEAKWIANNSLVQDVAVLDPTFNSGPQYLQILETLAQENYTGKMALQCRAEMIIPEFLDALERVNKNGKAVLEIGLQTIHKKEQKIIQRPNNLNKVTHVLEETRKRGIETEVSLIFGLPEQTLASFKESIEFCMKLDVPVIHAFPLMLLRGTPLHDLKEELQLVESTDVGIPNVERIFEGIPHVISSPSFTYTEWQEMGRIASNLKLYNSCKEETRYKEKSSLLMA